MRVRSGGLSLVVQSDDGYQRQLRRPKGCEFFGQLYQEGETRFENSLLYMTIRKSLAIISSHVHRVRTQPKFPARGPAARVVPRQRHGQETNPCQSIQVTPRPRRGLQGPAQGRHRHHRSEHRLRHRAFHPPWPCRRCTRDRAQVAPGGTRRSTVRRSARRSPGVRTGRALCCLWSAAGFYVGVLDNSVNHTVNCLQGMRSEALRGIPKLSATGSGRVAPTVRGGFALLRVSRSVSSAVAGRCPGHIGREGSGAPIHLVNRRSTGACVADGPAA